MTRRLLGLTALILTWPALGHAQQPATFPTGRFTMVMHDTTSELNRATFETTKDGHYLITHQGHMLFMGTYEVEANRITFMGRNDTPCLDANGNAIPGRYTWYVRDQTILQFTQMDDKCNERRLSAMIALFYVEGSAP